MEALTIKKKRTARPWTDEEVALLKETFVHQTDAELLEMFDRRTLKAIKNKARELNLRRPKPERKTPPKREPAAPKFTHCDICGEALPEEEVAMGAANHRGCWRRWVEDQKALEPVSIEMEEQEEQLLI